MRNVNPYPNDHMTDFQVEMMNEVNPECIRVSLRRVGQLSYEWI